MMKVLVLQNSQNAKPGSIMFWAEAKGYDLTLIKLYENQKIQGDFDLVVALGGVPTECKSWYKEEKDFLKNCIEQAKGVVGICLGSQILAEALGGELVPHVQSECGWWPLSFNELGKNHNLLRNVAESEIFFFHRNTVVLPLNMQLLASTEGCLNQIFTYGDRTIGIQGHPEILADDVKHIANNLMEYMEPGLYVKVNADSYQEKDRFDMAQRFLWTILDNLVNAISK